MSMSYLQQAILHGETEENGDCFRAAVASILGFESLDDVPHFCSVEVKGEWVWYQEFVSWLGQYGLSAFEVPWHPRWSEYLDGVTYLLSGPSLRFEGLDHTIVAYGSDAQLVWDPHPEGSGIKPWEENGDWFVTLIFPKKPWEATWL